MTATDEDAEPLGIDTWLDALAGVTAGVNRGIGRTELLDRIAAVTRQLTGFDFCAVLVADPQRQALRIAGSSGLSEEYVQRINGPLTLRTHGRDVDSPSARAFVSGTPVWVADVRAEPTFLEWSHAAHLQGYRCMLSVPLHAADVIAGTLNCYARAVTPRRGRVVQVVQALADHAGAVVETAELRAADQARLRELDELNRQLTEQRERNERSDELHRLLTAAALDPGGVPALAGRLADALGCRVRIDGADGDQLAHAPADGPELDVTAGDLLNADVVLDDRAVARIRAEPAPVGDDVQRRAIAHAATVCALILLRTRTAHAAAARARTDLVDDLLSDDTERVRDAVDRAAGNGYRMSVPRRLLLVRPHPPGRRGGELDAWAQVLGSRVPNLIVGRHRGDLVALWPDDPAAPSDPVPSLERLGVTADALLVVGPVCDRGEPERYRAAHRITRGAAGLAARLPHQAVIRLESLGVYHLLLQLDDPTAITRFAADTLRPLRDHDATHGTDLVTTLRTYLDHGCATRATAQMLYVHPNTVNLRLRRIEALTGVDLRRTYDLLNLGAALAADDVATLAGSGDST